VILALIIVLSRHDHCNVSSTGWQWLDVILLIRLR